MFFKFNSGKNLYLAGSKGGVINCPKCKSEKLSVIDSREVDERSIRRRRECEHCRYRFTTYEKIESVKLSVLKQNGKAEPFDRQKLYKGIAIAASHRLDESQLNDIVDEIEMKVLQLKVDQISSKKIGNIVISKLKKADEIAYLRFTSVYKNFKDIDSFEQELIKLKK